MTKIKKKRTGRPPMVPKAGIKSGTRYSCGGKKYKCGGRKTKRK